MARTQKRRTRLRRSPEEIARILASYDRCELTRDEFAAENGIAPGTLAGWLRRRGSSGPSPVGFMEVAAEQFTAPDARRALAGDEATGNASVPGGGAAGGFELVFDEATVSGIRSLRVSPGFDQADLERLLVCIAPFHGPSFPRPQ